MREAGRSIRGAPGQLAADWATGSRARRATLVMGAMLAAALGGAFLFGAWHILFGGLLKGNWRAGTFGAALAAVSAVLLAGEAAVARRLKR